MKINRWCDDLPATVFLSALGFLFSWLLGIIPYVGVFFALAIQAFGGWGIGYVVIPGWSRLVIMGASLSGFMLGFAHGSCSQAYIIVAGLIALLLFCLAFYKGLKMNGKEELRDSV